ncbi:hypothetical protein SNEBB_002291 [Seison nebaliae]|nr:hypothetical protein SNEBB_002291 [Seison nebaliae]
MDKKLPYLVFNALKCYDALTTLPIVPATISKPFKTTPSSIVRLTTPVSITKLPTTGYPKLTISLPLKTFPPQFIPFTTLPKTFAPLTTAERNVVFTTPTLPIVGLTTRRPTMPFTTTGKPIIKLTTPMVPFIPTSPILPFTTKTTPSFIPSTLNIVKLMTTTGLAVMTTPRTNIVGLTTKQATTVSSINFLPFTTPQIVPFTTTNKIVGLKTTTEGLVWRTTKSSYPIFAFTTTKIPMMVFTTPKAAKVTTSLMAPFTVGTTSREKFTTTTRGMAVFTTKPVTSSNAPFTTLPKFILTTTSPKLQVFTTPKVTPGKPIIFTTPQPFTTKLVVLKTSTVPIVKIQTTTPGIVGFTTKPTYVCRFTEWSEWSDCNPKCGRIRKSFRYRTLETGDNNECSEEFERWFDERDCSSVPCKCAITQFSLNNIFNNKNLYSPNIGGIGWLEKDDKAGYNKLIDAVVNIGDLISYDDQLILSDCHELKCSADGELNKVPININLCRRDCSWLDWSDWTVCGDLIDYCKTFNNSFKRIRARERIVEINGGKPCEGNKIEYLPCYYPEQCTKVNETKECYLGEWSDWTECTQKCGLGKTERKREILANQLSCSNETLTEVNDCNTRCCPIDATWSEWSNWEGECEDECQPTLRKRRRTCLKSECNGKDNCVGNKEQEEPCIKDENKCNVIMCAKKDQIYTTCANRCGKTCDSLSCTNSCVEQDSCKPGCECADGLMWDSLSEKCVSYSTCPCHIDGITYLPGDIIGNPDENSCSNCTCKNGCSVCTEGECINQVTSTTTEEPCYYSQWTDWGVCDKCDGKQNRYRSFVCKGNDTEQSEERECDECLEGCQYDGKEYQLNQILQATECKILICTENNVIEERDKPEAKTDGEWSLWSEWSECDENACNEDEVRFRLCNSPKPKCQGAPCVPSSSQNVTMINQKINDETIAQEQQKRKCNQNKCGYGSTRQSIGIKTTCDLPYEIEGVETSLEIFPGFYKDHPIDKCSVCFCEPETLKVICNDKCPTNMETCLQHDNDTFVYEPSKGDSCCGNCKRRDEMSNKCQPAVVAFDYVYTSDRKCRSSKKQAIHSCIGSCSPSYHNSMVVDKIWTDENFGEKAYENEDIHSNLIRSNAYRCECCRPSNVQFDIIEMSCLHPTNNGTVNEFFQYEKILGCTCSQCQ